MMAPAGLSFFKFCVLHHGDRTVLYVGMTGLFTQRVGQPKSGFIDGFTKKDGVDRMNLRWEVWPSTWAQETP